jgi:hypothetical protein
MGRLSPSHSTGSTEVVTIPVLFSIGLQAQIAEVEVGIEHIFQLLVLPN